MKLSIFLWAAGAIASAGIATLAIRAQRAANALPENFSKNSFALAPGETLLFEHSFDRQPTGWQTLSTEISGDSLHALPGTAWSEAVLKIPRTLKLGDGSWSFYWACRTDPAKGEDGSAVHVKLRVSDEPSRREQISINAIVRASPRWYMFYVDPGFEKPHPHAINLKPPAGDFPDRNTVRRFRITIVPAGTGKLHAEFWRWDETAGAWNRMPAESSGVIASPTLIDIAKDLEGHDTIKALNFMFPSPAAEIVATALSHAPSPPTAEHR